MRPAQDMNAQIKWGYGFNQWKFSWQDFARIEDNLRALKVTAACGFHALELSAGTGPWNPLGRPESIRMGFGSAAKFVLALRDCGIDRISSTFYDPNQMSFEELHHGLLQTRREDHAGILRAARIHAEFLAEVGGEYLVVRPAPSFCVQGALNDERMQAIAECWNAVGAMAQSLGLRTVLHIDALSALRTAAQIDQLLALTNPSHIGLALDTAELTIAGHNPLDFYQRYHTRVWHLHFKDALAVDSLNEYTLPNAERALIQAGGSRRIARWFSEMGTPEGLVNFPVLFSALQEKAYSGWIIVESDKGPQPAASAMMLNSWYVHRVLKQPLLV
jgi:inosose dehydratase